jgi:hypothetical protein
MSIFVLAASNLFIAGLTWLVLFLAVALGSAGAERLRKQQRFDIELGLTILGSFGGAFGLLWLTTSGYAVFLPGISLGLAAILISLRNSKRRTRRLETRELELSFSIGMVVIAWTFVRGAITLVGVVGHLLGVIGLEYGRLAGISALLAPVVIAAIAYRFFQEQRKRLNSSWSKQMQNVAYRKIEEEKEQLRRRITEIEDMQRYYEAGSGGKEAD